MGSVGNWKDLAAICVKIRDESTPQQWLLPAKALPQESQHNVLGAPAESGILDAEELEMTEQDVSSLLEAYRTGRWTVRRVVTAFLKRATVMQQLTNFATEFLTEDALARADELDEYFKSTGKLIGPLHGVPVSVKEHVAIAGRITHAGFVSFIENEPPSEDSHVVQLLKKAGAVIHVRTNQPQSLMHLDCNNNITGMTLNPSHRLLSPGGSSGGEGASIGSRCAILGVGTDIGGSVRAPAAFNGVYGLRPTAQRIPGLGNVGLNPGQESIRGVVGPLGQSVGDLQAWMAAILDQEPWEIETNLMPIPWKKNVELDHVTIGVLWDDGIVKPHPPMIRALKTAAEKLKNAGINVVDWEPLDHKKGWDIVAPLYFPDGGDRYLAEFAKTGEPALPLTEHALNFAKKSGKTPLSVADNWALNYEREKYRREYHALMNSRGVDFILCPTYPGAGVLQGGAKYWNYTAIWNILDQPSAVFPSGLKVDKAVDVKDEGYVPRNEEDEADWKAYDPDLFDGVPIALQLVGKRFNDEGVLEAVKLVESALKSGGK
ncbi:Amidase [Pleurostoma richardsiae]|uniref:amidase n=1 Tax=Pleurostoma richardsiae TaxID=41990 RepID=A0AA38RRT1_9PEZI|nr:Amidase [Pleurostoma richardsiae]